MKKSKKYLLFITILITISIGLNFGMSKLISIFDLPIYLDSIGTILASAIGGVLPGVITGFLSCLLSIIVDSTAMYYTFSSILIAIVVGIVAKKGYFRNLRKLPLVVVYTALISGILSFLCAWIMYGSSFDSSVYLNLAKWLYNNVGFNLFFSRFSASLIIDFLDKSISVAFVFVVLLIIPQKILKVFPLGYIYDHKMSLKEILLASKEEREKFFRRFSLKYKVILIIGIASICLGTASVIVGVYTIRQTSFERYTERAKAVSNLMALEIDADKINTYLETEEKDEDYYATVKRLEEIRSSVSYIEYMYVYQVREDGCHVVFDLDTEEIKADELGDLVLFDEEFSKYIDTLLAGEELNESIITRDQYGWLLSYYKPLYDSSGACVAYACADVDMESITLEMHSYIIEIIAMLFAITTLVIIFTIDFAERRIVIPINKMSKATEEYIYDSDKSRDDSVKKINDLQITTGDEIETLYKANRKTVDDTTDYIYQIQTSAKTIDRMQTNIIESFASLVESRDENTGEHISRTAKYVSILARGLEKTEYKDEITQDYINKVCRSAPLHDIGKISIPDAILNKAGKLTNEEYETMKKHVIYGRSILIQALKGIEDTKYLSEAINMASYHHERWDGKGYMQGLKGIAITLSARIMAVADVFDALTSKRSYKEAFSFKKSVAIIKEGSGTQFDPVVVQAFMLSLKEIEKVLIRVEQ